MKQDNRSGQLEPEHGAPSCPEEVPVALRVRLLSGAVLSEWAAHGGWTVSKAIALTQQQVKPGRKLVWLQVGFQRLEPHETLAKYKLEGPTEATAVLVDTILEVCNNSSAGRATIRNTSEEPVRLKINPLGPGADNYGLVSADRLAAGASCELRISSSWLNGIRTDTLWLNGAWRVRGMENVTLLAASSSLAEEWIICANGQQARTLHVSPSATTLRTYVDMGLEKRGRELFSVPEVGLQ